MRKIQQICMVICLLLVAGIAQADMTVLTFDGLGDGAIPNGYGDLNWDNMYSLSIPNSAGSGYDNGVVSNPRVAYNAYANPATVTGSMFDFGGAYLTAAWRDGLNVTVDGYLGSDLLYTNTVIIDHDAPTWFVFNYSGIDKLLFSSTGGVEVESLDGSGAHFAMDNFTVGLVPVPVPGAVLLGLLGLSAAGLKLRKYS